MGSRSTAVTVLALSLLLANSASANGPEDQLGLGARAAAMGGAGTALGGDPTATYYNVAGLGFCPESQVMLDVRHTGYGLRVERTGPDAPTGPVQPVPDQTRATLGACLRLPYRLAAGVIFGAGLEDAASLSQSTVNTNPQFVAYGGPLAQFTIAAGLSYRPIPELSVGIGGAIIVKSDLIFSTVVPIGGPDEVDFSLAWKLHPTGAPYVGVLVAPRPDLKIGLAYRGEIYHRLSGPLDIVATIGPADLPLPMVLSVDTWLSPRQAAAGGSFSPIRDLTLTADVTWYNYRALRDSGYPFLELTGGYSRLTLIFPEMDPVAWQDVWAIRAGGELRLADERLALRAGYNFRTAMLSLPNGRDSTLLDGAVHGVTIGAGYTLGHRRHRPDERAAAAREAAARRHEPPVEPGYEEEGWYEEERSTFVTRIDAFGRGSVMPERTDPVQQVAFHGVFFDAGLTATLGWY